jgi:hypothetical protein
MGSFPVLLLVVFLGCFPNFPLPPPFDSVVVSLPHGQSTCSFEVGDASWSPSTDGERLRARFFVAKCESAVDLLFPELFPTAETTLLVGAGGREERCMETTKGLCVFGRVSAGDAVVEDGDVVLA